MTDGQPAAGVLAGIKVVEFAQNVAVPYCGRLLAGMGADVVKVEPPAGDAMRALAPVAPGEGKAYAVSNTGKRSIVVDLADESSRPTVDALLRWADVALIGMKQADLDKFGLDWERAREINPRLVHLNANAFGPEGPDAGIGGYDVLAQARSGIGFIMNRTRNGVPTATRPAFIDTGTGIVSALGVVAALRHRDLTGEGQRVDTSLLGTAFALGTPMLTHFADLDEPRVSELCDDLAALRSAGVEFEDQRAVYEDRVIAAAGAFQLYFRPYATADGMVSVAGLSPALFGKFHELTGLANPGTAADTPEFAATVEQAEELFRTRTSAEWLDLLRDAGYPAAPYHHPFESLHDVQARANDYVVDVDHPTFGRYTTTGEPVRFGAAPTPATRPSPRLGEHTDEVLAELGLSDD